MPLGEEVVMRPAFQPEQLKPAPPLEPVDTTGMKAHLAAVGKRKDAEAIARLRAKRGAK